MARLIIELDITKMNLLKVEIILTELKTFFASFHSQLQVEVAMQSIDLLNSKKLKKDIFLL